MSQKSGTAKLSSERSRATRKQYSAEEKICVALGGLRGEHSIAELCRREGIAESLYYTWSKVLEAGKRRLAGDTARRRPAARSRTCWELECSASVLGCRVRNQTKPFVFRFECKITLHLTVYLKRGRALPKHACVTPHGACEWTARLSQRR